LYDSTLTEVEIHEIAKTKHKYAKKLSWRELAFATSRQYDYEIKDSKIYVREANPEEGRSTSAYIEVIRNKFGETIISITFYQPLLIVILCGAFGTVATIFAFWWAIFVGFAIGFGVNYLLFIQNWKYLETEIMRAFKIEK